MICVIYDIVCTHALLLAVIMTIATKSQLLWIKMYGIQWVISKTLMGHWKELFNKLFTV